MEKKKKIKDTKLGQWLKDKAPKVLDLVGDALPDQGALGIVKNLVEAREKDAEFDAALMDLEIRAQEAVTERWKSDNSSGNKLAQAVRPATLIALLSLYLVLAIADSIEGWGFDVKESYITLLEVLSMTAFGAYFAGRSYEKTKM